MTIRVHVHGAGGRMGSATVEAVRAADDLALCGTSGRGHDLGVALGDSRPDVVVEFTVPDAVEAHVRAILAHGAHVVSGTTGLADDAARGLGEVAAERGLGLLLAPNFAIGAVLLQRFARDAARYFRDVEILEMHHEKKLDAPSGTALDTARRIQAAAAEPLNAGRPPERELVPGARGARVGSVPVHAVRLPGLLAHQEVLFGGLGQVLTIRHDTLDRRAFMPGVLLAIRSVRRHRGLLTSLEPLLAVGGEGPGACPGQPPGQHPVQPPDEPER